MRTINVFRVAFRRALASLTSSRALSSLFLRTSTFLAAFVGIGSTPLCFVDAQTPAPEWDSLFERRDGWLGADGIYSIDLKRDVASSRSNASANDSSKTLFLFSDTFGGSTRDEGRRFGDVSMTSHSFAVLNGSRPNPVATTFYIDRRDAPGVEPSSENSPDFGVGDGERAARKPVDVLGVKRWLQDGCVVDGRLRFSAILVGEGWKPERVDAVSVGLQTDGTLDFGDVEIDETAPLAFKMEKAQVVFGAAINDDFEADWIYVFGYADRFDAGSRKDLVVSRAPRGRFDDFSAREYFDGRGWTSSIADVLRPGAALVEGVSTEFSVSKLESGANAGKLLLVYTPGVISDELAFRIAETPTGPFGREVVFYRSDVPARFEPGVRCYNAKAHPIFSDAEKILVSYNVNRLGSLARVPAEYRPRFVWLDVATVDAASENAQSPIPR